MVNVYEAIGNYIVNLFVGSLITYNADVKNTYENFNRPLIPRPFGYLTQCGLYYMF